MNRIAYHATIFAVALAILCAGAIAFYNGLTVTPVVEGWLSVIVSILLCFICYVGGVIQGLLTEPPLDDDTYLKEDTHA